MTFRVGLLGEQRVFFARLARAPGDMLRHQRGVVLEEGDVVAHHMDQFAIQFSGCGLVKSRFGAVNVVGRQLRQRQVVIVD